MNERIDKLMVKAGAYFGGEGVDYSNFDPKKFAELIVRECCQKLENDGMVEIAIEMKQHFGVEE